MKTTNIYEKKNIGLLISTICSIDNAELLQQIKTTFEKNNKTLKIIVVPSQTNDITPYAVVDFNICTSYTSHLNRSKRLRILQ